MDQIVFWSKNWFWYGSNGKADQGTAKAQCSTWRGEPHIKKSDCHIHATLKQRLDAVFKLRFQHAIKTLCRVLRVNRSTYYKHFFSEPSKRPAMKSKAKRTLKNKYLAESIGYNHLIRLVGFHQGINDVDKFTRNDWKGDIVMFALRSFFFIYSVHGRVM